ncbi:radical SAM family heme chaperone HemW [Tateyamaria omphalii]|uniref:radical SAM family heme chaperone HemW n=1 Tax=Tateyamaria omphalii TaxID=299262 RepID=UPI001C9936B0|nr:radical SAM family heme chaperone HemW [Tateyamaria omphalii]MBY5933395.1 radical SAM family heme chaperone HemW [Tateyamaria omphalii]
MAEDWEAGGFGLYVHWPFCAAKCPYCDFNSHVTNSVDHDAWRKALVAEVERVGLLTGGRVLRSVFFGGGTPSLMEPRTVEAILNTAARTWPMANDVEVTLEANPTSVEAHKFAAFRSAGVNRVSMGIQALNDPDLRALGRLHSAAEGLAAFDTARSVFDRVSFDLMYGRQNQSLNQWETELRQALSLDLDHVSLYQLTVEAGTAFGDRYKRGKLQGLPDDDLSADMYALTQDICLDHNMPRYEVSNHARDGSESRHNLIYWRYGDYAGIGPGAHGRLTLNGSRIATSQQRMPAFWLSGNNRETVEALSASDQATEYTMMGLRMAEGIDMDRYLRLSGREFRSDRLRELEEMKLITTAKRKIYVTDQGFSLLNGILRTLLDD